MASRPVSRALAVGAVCPVLAPLTGCGRDGGEPSSSKGGASATAGQSGAPAESRAPSRGKGSKDPDDLNGDGHRDLVVPLAAERDPDSAGSGDERVGVVLGSAKGLDRVTRVVYGRRDLGLPEPAKPPAGPVGRDSVSREDVVTADPDGDGRDGVLVATYEGATLIDGGRRTPVTRQGPATADGRKTPGKWRHGRPAGAADFDGDGTDELIMNWGSGTLFGLYGEQPTHWWITDGATSRDTTSFTTAEFLTRQGGVREVALDQPAASGGTSRR